MIIYLKIINYLQKRQISFGEVSFSPNKIINTKYEFSTKNNLQEIS